MPKDSTNINEQTFSMMFAIKFIDPANLVNVNSGCDEAIIFQTSLTPTRGRLLALFFSLHFEIVIASGAIFKLAVHYDKYMYLTMGSWSSKLNIQQFDQSGKILLSCFT